MLKKKTESANQEYPPPSSKYLDDLMNSIPTSNSLHKKVKKTHQSKDLRSPKSHPPTVCKRIEIPSRERENMGPTKKESWKIIQRIFQVLVKGGK